MQHIRIYYDKVEAVIASRAKPKDSKKKKSKGLLSSSKDMSGVAPKERNQLETIADIVQGIREAKEELLNARK